jgi:hypothetical protein
VVQSSNLWFYFLIKITYSIEVAQFLFIIFFLLTIKEQTDCPLGSKGEWWKVDERVQAYNLMVE